MPIPLLSPWGDCQSFPFLSTVPQSLLNVECQAFVSFQSETSIPRFGLQTKYTIVSSRRIPTTEEYGNITGDTAVLADEAFVEGCNLPIRSSSACTTLHQTHSASMFIIASASMAK